MTKRILTIALAVLALGLVASPALAAKAPHRYSPKHGAKCRKTYKRVKHGKKVYCVKQKAKAKKKAAPPSTEPLIEKTKLHSHLDPTFTRDPLNPFKVTYAFSASASQETFSAQDVRLGDEPAPLPSGVLSLFSDGKLECAVNVGAGVEGSECPVSYAALGAHTVTTIYTSGEQSATETEVEMIGPLATTTAVADTFEAEVPQPAAVGWTEIGSLTVTASASPAGASASIGCGEPPSETYGVLTAKGCFQFNGVATGEHIYVRNCNGSSAPSDEAVRIDSQAPSNIEPSITWPTVEQIEDGAFHVRAAVVSNAMQNPGYAPSEGTAALQFTPGGEC
jgi:hypothetical protein